MDEKTERQYSILFMAGAEGDSAYINDYRVSGPKPWGGGRIKWEGKTRINDLIHAVPELRALESQVATLTQQLADAQAKAALADDAAYNMRRHDWPLMEDGDWLARYDALSSSPSAGTDTSGYVSEQSKEGE